MNEAIVLSLKIAFISTIITFIIGIVLALLLLKYDFRFKNVIETIILLPLSLPPSVVGYLLLLAVGRNGWIGQYLYKYFNINIVFTWKAVVLAAIIVSLPLMYQSAKTAFGNIDEDIKNAARIDGASEIKVFLYITVPLAAKGLLGGVILSFLRSLGEFGATLIVAGNIPGQTQTIPLLLYFSIGNGDQHTAVILVTLVVALSFFLIYITNKLLGRKLKN